MTEADLQVMPIFAAPLAIATLAQAPAFNPPLAALLAARTTDEWRDPKWPPDGTSFRSRDNLCDWPDEPLQQALRAMLGAVREAVASISDFSAAEFAALRLEARAWFTRIGADGYVAPASYPNCSWLAVYCVTAPAPSATRFDSGVLRLLESRNGSSFQDASHGGLRLPYRPSHVTWRPVAGQLAAFPASITHEVAALRAGGMLTLLCARVRFLAGDKAWMPPW
jgi:hypothetical protein